MQALYTFCKLYNTVTDYIKNIIPSKELSSTEGSNLTSPMLLIYKKTAQEGNIPKVLNYLRKDKPKNIDITSPTDDKTLLTSAVEDLVSTYKDQKLHGYARWRMIFLEMRYIVALCEQYHANQGNENDPRSPRGIACRNNIRIFPEQKEHNE